MRGRTTSGPAGRPNSASASLHDRACASLLATSVPSPSLWAIPKDFEADRTQREMQFGIAVLSIQMKDWDAAEADLHDLKQAELAAFRAHLASFPGAQSVQVPVGNGFELTIIDANV